MQKPSAQAAELTAMSRAEAWWQDLSLATDAEQGLIGSLLTYPDSFVAAAAIVEPSYFLEPSHRTVFEAIAYCRKAGLRGAIGEIRQALGSTVLATKVEGEVDLRGYLAVLRQEGASSASTKDYARAVRSHYALRTLAGTTFIGNGPGLPEEKVRAAFDRIDALRAEIGDAAGTIAPIGTIAHDVLERAIAISEGSAIEPGVTTGFVDLDRTMLGYRPGELVIMAGRPGMGKTTLGTSSAVKSTDPRRDRTAGGIYFGLELGRDAIGARCLSDLALERHLSPTHSQIRAGRVDRAQIELLQDAECRLNELELDIDHRSSISIGEIEAKCRAVQRRLERSGKTLGVIFVDYLKQVRSGDRYSGNRVYEIGEITAGLRDLAKRLQLCVVLLTQLNRGVEGRQDKRPTLADLRESGDLENDADVVLLLYRPAYYLNRDLQSASPDEAISISHLIEIHEHELEVIVGKNRNGEGEQVIKLWCDIGRSAVRDASLRQP